MATPSISLSTYPTVPPTLLPSDPKALARYLRNQQLSSLRRLFEHKTLAVTQQFEERAASLRGRHGRTRRRRGSSPLEGERDVEAEEEEEDLEVRKRMRYDPDEAQNEVEAVEAEGGAPAAAATAEGAAAESSFSSTLAKKPRRPRPYSDTSVDSSHRYDLAYDLAPDASADAYYHGPHPPPPSRVVRTVLRATRKKPFLDPEGLSAAQLEALTARLWAEDGTGLSIFFGEENGRERAEAPLSRDQERYQREINAATEEEWEASVIAGFSATCDEKIGRGVARKPMTAREMAAQQVQQQAQQQAAAAAAQQQQQQQAHGQPAPQQASAPAAAAVPVPGYAASQYGEQRERYPSAQGAPYWR